MTERCFVCGRSFDHRVGCPFRIPDAIGLREALDMQYGRTPPEPDKDDRRRRVKKARRSRRDA